MERLSSSLIRCEFLAATHRAGLGQCTEPSREIGGVLRCCDSRIDEMR